MEDEDYQYDDYEDDGGGIPAAPGSVMITFEKTSVRTPREALNLPWKPIPHPKPKFPMPATYLDLLTGQPMPSHWNVPSRYGQSWIEVGLGRWCRYRYWVGLRCCELTPEGMGSSGPCGPTFILSSKRAAVKLQSELVVYPGLRLHESEEERACFFVHEIASVFLEHFAAFFDFVLIYDRYLVKVKTPEILRILTPR